MWVSPTGSIEHEWSRVDKWKVPPVLDANPGLVASVTDTVNLEGLWRVVLGNTEVAEVIPGNSSCNLVDLAAQVLQADFGGIGAKVELAGFDPGWKKDTLMSFV